MTTVNALAGVKAGHLHYPEIRIHPLAHVVPERPEDEFPIQDSLAHKSLDATLVYTWLDLDPVRESVAKATAAMVAAAMPDECAQDWAKANRFLPLRFATYIA